MLKLILKIFPELAITYLSIMCLYSRNIKYGLLLAGCLVNIYLGLALKRLTPYLIPLIDKTEILRPDDAFACNMDKEVSNRGEVGMPSNHSMLAGYLFAVLHKKTPYAYLLLMIPFSRLRDNQFPIINHGKHACHTWGQITTGFIIGVMFGKSYKFI
jgi:hypothetical protein